MDNIYKDFVESTEKLEVYSNLIAELLRKQEKVHTVRSRIKDAEHLIAKLIRKTPSRKKKYGSDYEFTVENYKKEITDLIGVRVIHIFKEDWQSIHDFINSNWKVTESQANIREGDDKEQYTGLGVEINSRETGYRSVHYLIEFMPTNQLITAEIQVRTIFEEGYGEIDHQLSYPNTNIPKVLLLNLLMLNRLAGSADEMASAVKTIKDEWSVMQSALKEKNSELEDLKNKIEKLDIQQEEKAALVKDIGKLEKSKSVSEIIAGNLYGIKFDDSTMRNISKISTSASRFSELDKATSGLKVNDSLFRGLDKATSGLKVNDSLFRGLDKATSGLKVNDSLFRGLDKATSGLRVNDSLFSGLDKATSSWKVNNPMWTGLNISTSTAKSKALNETDNNSKEN